MLNNNKLLSFLMGFAGQYDDYSEKMIDNNMCTEVCPCYSVEKWDLNENGVKTRRIDPEYTYGQLSEDLLNFHNRTF